MEFRGILLAAVCVCFLACVQVEVTSTSIISLSSFWRQQSCPNSGGSLITISTDQCTSTSGHRRCEAKCNGRTTAYKDKGTRFTMIETSITKKRKAVQLMYTDNQNTRFALKVINATNIVFEEQTNNSTSSSFEQIKKGKHYLYKRQHGTDNMCLICGCDGKLSLSSKSNNDRHCFFCKLR